MDDPGTTVVVFHTTVCYRAITIIKIITVVPQNRIENDRVIINPGVTIYTARISQAGIVNDSTVADL